VKGGTGILPVAPASPEADGRQARCPPTAARSGQKETLPRVQPPCYIKGMAAGSNARVIAKARKYENAKAHVQTFIRTLAVSLFRVFAIFFVKFSTMFGIGNAAQTLIRPGLAAGEMNFATRAQNKSGVVSGRVSPIAAIGWVRCAAAFCTTPHLKGDSTYVSFTYRKSRGGKRLRQARSGVKRSAT
jgi:hypothetical protein